MPDESLYNEQLVGDEVETQVLIPEGDYEAIITSIDPYVASTGNKCAWWRFKLSGDNEYAGTPLSSNTNLPVSGLSKEDLRKCWKWRGFCEAISAPLRSTVKEVEQVAKGKKVIARVVNSFYGGVERSAVDGIVTKQSTEIPF